MLALCMHANCACKYFCINVYTRRYTYNAYMYVHIYICVYIHVYVYIYMSIWPQTCCRLCLLALFRRPCALDTRSAASRAVWQATSMRRLSRTSDKTVLGFEKIGLGFDQIALGHQFEDSCVGTAVANTVKQKTQQRLCKKSKKLDWAGI